MAFDDSRRRALLRRPNYIRPVVQNLTYSTINIIALPRWRRFSTDVMLRVRNLVDYQSTLIEISREI